MADRSPESLSQKWTRLLRAFTKPMLRPILVLSNHAARYPKSYIVSVIALSFGLMVIGVATNFNEDTSDEIWSPQGSKPVLHNDWVEDHSNFPKETRASLLIVHRGGKNLFGDDDGASLARESVTRMFEALDTFRDTSGYDEVCSHSGYINPITNVTTCEIVGATTFWNQSSTSFFETALSDEDVLATMSQQVYPSGISVDFDQIIGYNKFDDKSKLLSYGETYVIVISLPPDKDADEDSEAAAFDFEEDVLDRILDLQNKWNAQENNDFMVEILAERSFEDEFGRAVTKGT